MSSDWETVPIESLCLGIYDGPHATPKKTQSGPIFLGISALNNGQLDLSTAEHLSEEDFSKWTRRVTPQAGDIVFSYETRLGQVAVIPEGLRCCLGRRMALMRVNPKKVTSDYLLYAYLSPDFQEVIRQRTIHGSTVDRIPLVEFGSFPITVPPLDIQNQIVGILRTLDDRISVLRETSATLEAIVQALFKSWFVDFDPVRAKMEGRAPEGMDEALATLFPDALVESELGFIPEGWKVAKFEEFTKRLPVGKKFDQKSARESGTIPILDQGKSGVIGFHEETPGVRASLDHPVVVFANHTCYMRLITFDFSAIQNVLPFVGLNVDTVWAYYATKGRVKFSEYKGHWPDFAIEKTVLPVAALTSAFRGVVDPLVRSLRANELQAQTLAKLRETLLPRLISGQLQVTGG